MDVALYLRLSLDREGNQLGVARQEAECRAYAEARGWTVTTVYTDNDLSATSGKRRPAFEDLLAAKPPAVLVWHNDRLVRNGKDLERVIDLGLTVHAVTAGDFNLSTPAGRMMARQLVNFATYEVEQKGERQRAEMFQRAQRGRPNWARRPFGFNMDGTHRPDEAAALRAAYEGTRAGASRHEIARQMNASGLRTAFRDREWSATNVRQALASPRNAGLREYKGKIIGEAAWEPIVDRELWDTVQTILASAKAVRQGRGREYVSLLSGIAKCGKCGHPLRGAGATRQGVLTYRCTGPDWCITNVPRDIADAYVWHQAMTACIPARDPEALAADAAAREAVDTRLADIKSKLIKAASMWAEDLLSEDQFKTVTLDLRDQERSLREQKAVLALETEPDWDELAERAIFTGKALGPAGFGDELTPIRAIYPPVDMTIAQSRAMLRDLAVITIAPRGKGCRQDYVPADHITVSPRRATAAGTSDAA